MNPTRRRILAASAGILATPALFTASSAQTTTFPSKPIRIVVPYPAGGQTYGIARSFGDFLARKLGQSVVVENKGGAGGDCWIGFV